MELIGIAGKMGTGKSALMCELSMLFDHGAELNFGDLLKKEVSELYGFPLTWCYSEDGKNTQLIRDGLSPGITVRELLQWYGTDIIRKKDPNHWCDRMGEELIATYVRYIFIGDIRFPNEAEFIRSRGGKVIRLNPYPEWDKSNDHTSETALDDYGNFWLTIAPPFGTLTETARYIKEIM